MANYQYRNREERNAQYNRSANEKNNNSRTNRQLKTASGSVKTRTMVKRKLLIYRKDGKMYIDHSAAYALGLTNARAIMMGKPHLIECDSTFFNQMQSDRSIEIEYSDVDDLKEEVGVPQDDLSQAIDTLENGEYGIGIHSIAQGNADEKINVATSICNEGLTINNNSKTVLSTAISLGTNDAQKDMSREATTYNLGNSPKTLIIIAAPLCIQNRSGEKIFLGFPEVNKSTSAQQYEEHCILDRICGNLKKVPPEFILGYYCENDGSPTFVENQAHYSMCSEAEKEGLYNEIFQSMDDISKNINNLIASGNIDALMQMQEKMQFLRMSTYMIDNAILLCQHYRERETSIDIGMSNDRISNSDEVHQNLEGESERNDEEAVSAHRKSTRRIILNDIHSNEVSSPKNKRIRKILMESYSEITMSDLADGKGKLRAGKEEMLLQEGNTPLYEDDGVAPGQE